MIEFIAGIMFAMVFWGVIASRIGDKITDDPDDKDGIRVTRIFFASYILVLAVLLGVMTGALLL